MANDYSRAQKFQLKRPMDSVIALINTFQNKQILVDRIPEEEYNKVKTTLNDFVTKYLQP